MKYAVPKRITTRNSVRIGRENPWGWTKETKWKEMSGDEFWKEVICVCVDVCVCVCALHIEWVKEESHSILQYVRRWRSPKAQVQASFHPFSRLSFSRQQYEHDQSLLFKHKRKFRNQTLNPNQKSTKWENVKLRLDWTGTYDRHWLDICQQEHDDFPIANWWNIFLKYHVWQQEW